jgi:uncharacterized protein (DUF3820 family)
MDSEQLQRLLTTEMPYGKYKGRPIADLPGNYLNWFAREGFPAGGYAMAVGCRDRVYYQKNSYMRLT